jgi:DNA repair protein RadA/Sms
MAKTRTVYECQTCGSQFPKWLGRCNECGGWNTLVESVIGSEKPETPTRAISDAKVVSLSDVDVVESHPIPTGIDEFDHVVGGGLVSGSVTLIGGEPGIGKSTLVMQIVGSLANKGTASLYASAEESSAQIRGRASRLGVTSELVKVLSTNRLEDILFHAREEDVSILIVDSIHTVACDDISSTAGTVSQVRECAHRLTEFAKSTNTTVLVVGQVTKEGTLAGPRVLEHVVDTVLSFEGDDHALVRTLRASKHRFGTTDELGLFDMTEKGLIALDDPSSFMSAITTSRPSGLAVAAAVDGSRPFLIEVQALVVPTTAPVPRRVVQGVDNARVSSLIAVLEKRCSLRLSQCDVYVSLVGGLKVKDAGLDLAICVAIASADKDVAVARDDVFAGEVGLSGEIRPSVHTNRRLREAARRGHQRMFLNPGKSKAHEEGISIVTHDFVSKVLAELGL